MNRKPRRTAIRASLQYASGQGIAASTSRRHRPDYGLLILTALLLVIGLVVVYSISPGLAASQNVSQSYFITKQLIDIGLGIGAFALAAYLPVRTWKRIATPLVAAAAIGSLIVMATPLNEIYQAHRWIRLGSYSLQIAELIKLAMIVWLARFLSEQWSAGRLRNFKSTFRPLLAIMLTVGVIVAKFQSDLGSAAVIVAILGLMIYTIGVPLKKIAMILVLILALASVAIFTSSYRRERVATFLHPQTNCQGSNYHACQALISVGSGGVLGLGLGYSVQAYGYTPEAGNDSIFAIIAEEFGFVGSVVLVTIYGLFIYRLKRLIERTVDQFSRLLVVGVLAWLSTQMIINIGAMLGLLPLKGITLPLISQGGTSLIFLTAALGLVFQISRYTSYSVIEPQIGNGQKQQTGNYFDRRRFGRPHHAPSVTRPRN